MEKCKWEMRLSIIKIPMTESLYSLLSEIGFFQKYDIGIMGGRPRHL